MNSEIKKRWIAALRGGEYKQGQRALRYDNNNYCCLGVLCDLHSHDTGTGWREKAHFLCAGADLEKPIHSDSYLGSTGLLPREVIGWAGMHPDSGTELIRMNDNGVTFEKIADYIEKHF